jgi:hypothetical protein
VLHLRKYLADTVLHWYGAVSALFLVAGMGFGLLAAKNPSTDYAFWFAAASVICLIGGLVLAPYFAYSKVADERDSAISAQLNSQLQAQAPNLIGTINSVIGGSNKADSATLGVFVNMTVLNRGAPSIVDNFQPFLTISGLRSQLPPYVIADDTTLHASKTQQIRLTSMDAIYEKRNTIPLERGAQIRGWLYFKVPNMTTDRFFRDGTSVEVEFTDYLGKSYSASQALSASAHDQFQYFPGSQDVRQSMPLTPRRKQRRAKR